MNNKFTSTNITLMFDCLLEKPWRPNTFRLFSKVFLLWLLARNLVLLPMATEFWGPKAYIGKYFDSTDFTSYITNLLNLFSGSSLYIIFLIGYFASYFLALCDFWPRLFKISGLFFLLNLNNKAPTIADGGDNLAMLIASLLIFVDTQKVESNSLSQKSSFLNWFNILVSNTASFIICLQIVVVYLTAGMCKFIGPMWQQGMALFYIMQNDNYSNDWVANHVNYLWPMTVVGTYLTLAFQLSLPWLIWRKIGFIIIVPVGIAIHLGIAIGMALPSFGLIMCVSYLAFLPDNWSQALSTKIKFEVSRLNLKLFSRRYFLKRI